MFRMGLLVDRRGLCRRILRTRPAGDARRATPFHPLQRGSVGHGAGSVPGSRLGLSVAAGLGWLRPYLSADPAEAPAINPNYLADPLTATLLAGTKRFAGCAQPALDA